MARHTASVKWVKFVTGNNYRDILPRFIYRFPNAFPVIYLSICTRIINLYLDIIHYFFSPMKKVITKFLEHREVHHKYFFPPFRKR